MTPCPLSVDLDRNEIRIRDNPPQRVRPKVAELLHVLAGSWGRPVTDERLLLRMWGTEGGNTQTLGVFTCYARKALSGSGLAILRHFGKGLELVAIEGPQSPARQAQQQADQHDRLAETAGYGKALLHREVAQAYRALAAALHRLEGM